MITTRHSWLALVLTGVVVLASCTRSVWNDTHHGIRYSIHVDKRNHRIEREKAGRLMYVSPELIVVSEDGRLTINGEDGGPLREGDHVVVTDLGTVLVNGQRRGDTQSGQEENRRRIRQAKALMEQKGLTSQQAGGVELTVE